MEPGPAEVDRRSREDPGPRLAAGGTLGGLGGLAEGGLNVEFGAAGAAEGVNRHRGVLIYPDGELLAPSQAASAAS